MLIGRKYTKAEYDNKEWQRAVNLPPDELQEYLLNMIPDYLQKFPQIVANQAYYIGSCIKEDDGVTLKEYKDFMHRIRKYKPRGLISLFSEIPEEIREKEKLRELLKGL